MYLEFRSHKVTQGPPYKYPSAKGFLILPIAEQSLFAGNHFYRYSLQNSPGPFCFDRCWSELNEWWHKYQMTKGQESQPPTMRLVPLDHFFSKKVIAAAGADYCRAIGLCNADQMRYFKSIQGPKKQRSYIATYQTEENGQKTLESTLPFITHMVTHTHNWN